MNSNGIHARGYTHTVLEGRSQVSRFRTSGHIQQCEGAVVKSWRFASAGTQLPSTPLQAPFVANNRTTQKRLLP